MSSLEVSSIQLRDASSATTDVRPFLYCFPIDSSRCCVACGLVEFRYDRDARAKFALRMVNETVASRSFLESGYDHAACAKFALLSFSITCCALILDCNPDCCENAKSVKIRLLEKFS